MTRSSLKTLALTIAVGTVSLATLFGGSPAEAGGKGKRGVTIQEYTFAEPMNGFDGHEGGGYCSFQKIPNTTCNAAGKCKVTSWTLRQICQ